MLATTKAPNSMVFNKNIRTKSFFTFEFIKLILHLLAHTFPIKHLSVLPID